MGRPPAVIDNHMQPTEPAERPRLTVNFSLGMSEAQYAELEELAVRHGVSMARVARRALRSGLGILRKSPRLSVEFSAPE